jgi:hypothetical protein
MKVRIPTAIALISGLMFLLSSLGSAQQQNEAIGSFNVPFEFWVNSTRFAPGEYYLDNSEPTMVIIRSIDSRHVEIAGTLLDGDPVSLSTRKDLGTSGQADSYCPLR